MDIITFPDNLSTTSGLSILLHDFISLPDVTSYDKYIYNDALLKDIRLKNVHEVTICTGDCDHGVTFGKSCQSEGINGKWQLNILSE